MSDKEDDAEEWWRASGISPEDQRSFREWKFDAGSAARWLQAGVTDGVNATRWQIAHVTPDVVALWRAAGIESLEALQWFEHGYSLEAAKKEKANGGDPSQLDPTHRRQSQGPIRRGRRSGQFTAMASGSFGSGGQGLRGPNGEMASQAFQDWFAERGHQQQVAHLYLMSGWMSDEALPWAQADINPEAARLWALLAIRPSEAARLEKDSVKASDVVRDWWAAGIPLDQVAAWLGAGLSPEEAAAQIAAGVTADQAAVLRALRDDDDED